MTFVELFLGTVLLLVFAYVLVRVASFAYFRTKFEHLRAVLRELRKDDTDNG